MTKKSSNSKMTDETAHSYGFGKTTLGRLLVATSDKKGRSILIDGSNAPAVTRHRRSTFASSRLGFLSRSKSLIIGQNSTFW
jgi:ABC-type glutathione transport system ATPase component